MANQRGRISKYYTVWCGDCERHDHIEAKSNPSKEARQNGWKNTRDLGWLCPDCQQKDVCDKELDG